MGDSMMRSYVTGSLMIIFLSSLAKHGTEAKVFQRCELAQLLLGRHRLSRSEVATLVCIAQHTSGFNTATFGGGTGPAGGSHGIFQISDVYWCSTTPGAVRGCNLACGRLRDDDITDDLACVRQIHADHQRIAGDGYSAWQAYEPYCKRNAESYVADCLSGSDPFKSTASFNHPQIYKQPSSNSIQNSLSKSKIYNRCELAQELYYKHKMPMTQIPTFVCIAQHESNFDTSAVGRLNADGSADHGLFQISDLYWCSHDRWGGGKACGLPCSKLLDNDITDDVRCVKRIYNEHEGISGDGFTAWTVYNRDCRNQGYEHVSACFNKPAANSISHKPQVTHPNALAPAPHKSYANPFFSPQTQPQRVPSQNQNQYYKPSQQQSPQVNPFLRQPTIVSHQQYPNAIASPTSHKPGSYSKYQSSQSATNSHTQNFIPHHGKVYKRCELAQEMYFKHKFPIQDIATWTCIAEHESRFDTSAVGRLNTDGSADHGLFQVSDLYWCTHDERGGKGCGLPCEKLLDSDITDDVKCIRTIHEEHTRISGDGFTAWVVYDRNCKKQTMTKISDCFDEEMLKEMSTLPQDNEIPITKLTKPQKFLSSYGPIKMGNSLQNHSYSHNIFLNQLKVENNLILDAKKQEVSSEKPVIDVVRKTSTSEADGYKSNPFLNNKNFNKNEVKPQANKVMDVVKKTTVNDHSYHQNPFLNNKNQVGIKMQVENNKVITPINKNSYNGNPFLNQIPNPHAKKPVTPLEVPVTVKKNPTDNRYLSSESFRKTATTTTRRPVTTKTPIATSTRTTQRPTTTSTAVRTTAAINTITTQRVSSTTPVPRKTITNTTPNKGRPTTAISLPKTTTKTTLKPYSTTTTTRKYNWNSKPTTKIPVPSTTREVTTKTPFTTTRSQYTTVRTPFTTTKNPLSNWKWTSFTKNTTSTTGTTSGDGSQILKTTSKPLTTTKLPRTTSTVKSVETKYHQKPTTNTPRTTPIPKAQVQNTNTPLTNATKKPDPFDHPFFAKFKLQFEKPTQSVLSQQTLKEGPKEKTNTFGSTTTTRKPTSTITTTTKTSQRSTTTTKHPLITTSVVHKSDSEKNSTKKPMSTNKTTPRPTITTKRPTVLISEVLKDSLYYEKFRNNTSQNSKTISAYGFGQNYPTQPRKHEESHDSQGKTVTTPSVNASKNATQSLFDLYLVKWNKN